MARLIETAADLPQPGRVNERNTLDFKQVPSADAFEIAKDVAALANALGGTLLLGAAGAGEFLRAYTPLARREASEAQRTYEQAVRDRCAPRPVVTTVAIEQSPHHFVVAVNVLPFPGQVVGVRTTLQNDVYYYPVRIGAHTVGIEPEQLAMYVDARIRRVVLQLEQARGQKVLARADSNERGKLTHWMWDVELVDVDMMTNTLTLRFDEGEDPIVSVPLDFVGTVWKEAAGWTVLLRGYFDTFAASPEDGQTPTRTNQVRRFFVPFVDIAK